jgi:hypothetical protein
VLVIGLTFFLIDETDAATSAFKSGRALAIMAVAVVGWLVARVVLGRFVTWPGVRAGVFGVAAAIALAVVVIPAYDDDTVVESFPAVATVTENPPGDQDESSPPSTSPASTTTTSIQPTREPVPQEAPRPTTPTTTTTEVPKATRFRVGSFEGIDHRAEGTVAFYRQPDGRYVVGLEDFDIQPGPDYDVYLVPGSDREDRDGGRRLDDLRGNRGTQFYDVPSGVALEDGEWTLLIWCQTFAVPVANATPH